MVGKKTNKKFRFSFLILCGKISQYFFFRSQDIKLKEMVPEEFLVQEKQLNQTYNF